MGKAGRRAFGLDELLLLPGRRTRDDALVDLSWQIDAFSMDLPFMSAGMDSVTSPETAVTIDQLGGLPTLNLEGLWARHLNAEELLAELAELPGDKGLPRLRELYKSPIDADLLVDVIRHLKEQGVTIAGAVSPKHTVAMSDILSKVELDLLVIRGSVISAEHVTATDDALNLKSFVRELETPVIVGGCASYQAGLHLMRTGAAGVLVGVDSGSTATTGQVTGLGSKTATALADVRAARMRHLDETGVYVHVIADGGLRTGGQIAKAVACGADAVVLGRPLAGSKEAPGQGWHWDNAAVHPELPQGRRIQVDRNSTLRELLLGPSELPDGTLNIFGALRHSMATLGYESVKELQKAEILVTNGAGESVTGNGNDA